ncbi:MAG: hypothetical protein JNM48_11540 [Rhodospirillales bacterium]|nr:hypothetical protein [Rhodospirillales bacterium]
MTAWRLPTARASIAALALLATLLRLTSALIMPVSAQGWLPSAPIDDAYARFVATFGPDATICAAMSGPGGRQGQSRDGPAPGQVPDCDVCPLCTSIRDAAAAMLLAMPPVLSTPIVFTASAPPIPDDGVPARPAHAWVRARAPPTL